MGQGALRRGTLIGPTLAAFGLVVVLVCGIFAFLLHAVADNRDQTRRARQTQAALVLTARLNRMAVDLETGTRGRLLTGERRFLAPYRTATAAIPDVEAQLRRLLTGRRERRQLDAL